MSNFKKNFFILLIVGRFYSIPISIVSWIIPFIYSLLDGGNIYYGLLALIGIIFIHMGVNSFDDIIDYIKESREIAKGLKNSFDFQEGKCQCLFNGDLTLKQYTIISFLYFAIGLGVGIYFFNIYGIELLKIVIPSALLCILYPIFSYIGLGEIVVGIIYAPLLYLGVNYVMCGHFDLSIMIYSISTGLLTIAVLHNHMLLDFNIDSSSRKITLCRLLKNKANAFFLLLLLIISAYINLRNILILNNSILIYLLPILSFPQAAKLIKEMYNHLQVESVISKEEFIEKFLLPQKLLISFTILLGIAMILDKLKQCIL